MLKLAFIFAIVAVYRGRAWLCRVGWSCSRYRQISFRNLFDRVPSFCCTSVYGRQKN